MIKNTGKNLKYLRENNTNQILKYLTVNQGSSRIELSKQLGLSKMTITNIISDLLDKGYIVEQKASIGTTCVSTGPKPMRLTIKEKRILSIGVYVSRERLYCTLCDIIGNDIYTFETEINKNIIQGNLIDIICSAIDTVLSYNPSLNRFIIGIGVSMIGLVDSEQGLLIKSTDFLGNSRIPIRSILSTKYPYPVFISNDMKATALAEVIYGYGRNYNDFVCVGITYGVGSAIVSAGNVLKGKRGFGNEIGHMSVNYQGEQCACGNRGCLELYTGIHSLLRKTDSINLADLLHKLHNGEVRTLEVMEKFVDVMYIALTNIVNIFDPECIIFSHEGSLFIDRYIHRLEEFVNVHSLQHNDKKVKLLISTFQSIGALRGSATLVFNKLFEGIISI